MIIYIRHANDDTKSSKYKNDPHITKDGKKAIGKVVKKLTKKYGYPDEIRFSPFRRCRETIMEMVNQIVLLQTGENPDYCFKCYDYDIKLTQDIGLSRYFTSAERKNPQVSSKTLKRKIPINESHDTFHKRLETQIVNAKRSKKKVVWCITHAVTYKKIGLKLQVSTPDHIEFLEYFVYKK